MRKTSNKKNNDDCDAIKELLQESIPDFED